MVKNLLVLFFLFNCYFTYAETIKTDVLVIGNGPGAAAAAMQCARSKVKTLLIVKGGWLENMQDKNMQVVETNRNLPSGIWGEFSKEVRSYYKRTGDTSSTPSLRFEPCQ